MTEERDFWWSLPVCMLLWAGRVIIGRLNWNGRQLSGDTKGETLNNHCCSLPRLILITASRVLFSNWSWHGRLLVPCDILEMYVFICNLSKYLPYRWDPHDCTRNCFKERKWYTFQIMVIKHMSLYASWRSTCLSQQLDCVVFIAVV